MTPEYVPKGDERRFLEGPGTRKSDLGFIFRIARDLFSGIRALSSVGPCITVFGSARMGEAHPYYDLARRVGGSLAELGFTVMTGGGPGLMEAANRGAQEAGGARWGATSAFPSSRSPTPTSTAG